MTVYRSTGTLTGTIEADNVATAQEYLTSDDMTQYIAPQSDLVGVLEFIEWQLHADGHEYHVTAVTNRELDEAELKRLADAVSGQNSDGLGEGFEQQPWAETHEEDYEDTCGYCNGSGQSDDEEYDEDSDEADEYCQECGGEGTFLMEGDYGMISFDWNTNDSAFTKVS